MCTKKPAEARSVVIVGSELLAKAEKREAADWPFIADARKCVLGVFFG